MLLATPAVQKLSYPVLNVNLTSNLKLCLCRCRPDKVALPGKAVFTFPIVTHTLFRIFGSLLLRKAHSNQPNYGERGTPVPVGRGLR